MNRTLKGLRTNEWLKLLFAIAALLSLGLAPAIRIDAAEKPKVYVCPDCGCPDDGREFDKPGKCPSCGMQLVEKTTQQDRRVTVAVLLFDGAEVIDYAGPWEAFGEAGCRVFTVAESSKPIAATFGQKILADYTFANNPPADILLVPGGSTLRATQNAALIKWVQEQAARSKQVMSVCTGAFILAKAGLLDGLTATTVAHSIDQLGQVSPKTKVVRDQRYVDNGKIITTAGLSSGIDGAFHVIAKLKGTGFAQSVALGMEYQWEPDGKFARASLADTYFPEIDDVDAKVLSTTGDTTRWEFKALVSKPGSPAEILDLVRKHVATATPRAHGEVAVETEKVEERALRWKFTDEQGRTWNGSAQVEAASEPNKFVLTLKLFAS